MGVVEDPLVLKKIHGYGFKEKTFPGRKRDVSGGMIASYGILELNQIKVNRVLLMQICQ